MLGKPMFQKQILRSKNTGIRPFLEQSRVGVGGGEPPMPTAGYEYKRKRVEEDAQSEFRKVVKQKPDMNCAPSNVENYDLKELVRRRSGMELAAERWTGAHEWMQKFDSDKPDYHYWKGIKTAALTQFKDFSGIQDNEEAFDKLLEIAGVEKLSTED